jgi:polyisoprenoid-binding protein YceI
MLKSALVSLALLLSMVFSAQAAEVFTFDPSHSYVLWHVSHLGFSNLSGRWPVQGKLTLDESNPPQSQVSVTILMAELLTGVPKLDEHLRGKNFFDVAQFPVATFVSEKVIVTGKKTAKVSGILTLHGVSKPVVLNMILNRIGFNPVTDRKTVGFTGFIQLKRSDFGVDSLVSMVGNDVDIEIEAEAYMGQPYSE